MVNSGIGDVCATVSSEQATRQVIELSCGSDGISGEAVLLEGPRITLCEVSVYGKFPIVENADFLFQFSNFCFIQPPVIQNYVRLPQIQHSLFLRNIERK